jgi:hypothetical protein
VGEPAIALGKILGPPVPTSGVHGFLKGNDVASVLAGSVKDSLQAR